MSATELIIRFDAWITQEYKRLRERLSVTGAFDEDAFHDAYISVRAALSDDSITDNFSTAFCQAYKKISKRHVSEAFAVYTPENLFFNQLSDRAPEPLTEHDIQQDRDKLVNNIRQHVKSNFSPMYVLIWESRTLRDMSYIDISAISGMGYRRVKSSIENINSDVRQCFAYAIQSHKIWE